MLDTLRRVDALECWGDPGWRSIDGRFSTEVVKGEPGTPTVRIEVI